MIRILILSVCVAWILICIYMGRSNARKNQSFEHQAFFPSLTWSWFWKFLAIGLAIAFALSEDHDQRHSLDMLEMAHPVFIINWSDFRQIIFWYFVFAAPAYQIGRRLKSKESLREGYRQALSEWPLLTQEQRDYYMSLVGEIRTMDRITSAHEGGKVEWERMQDLKQRIERIATNYPPMAIDVLNDIRNEQDEYLRDEYLLMMQRENGARAKP